VGYALADHLRTGLVSAALANALAARDPGPGVTFHSDRGCQYTSLEFAALAAGSGVTLSLGRTGQCWDNALSESFFASLNGELIDLHAWPTRAMARRAIVEHIAWYNGTRLHGTLGYKTPAEFEEQDKIPRGQRGGHQRGGMTWPGSAMTSRPLQRSRRSARSHATDSGSGARRYDVTCARRRE
jgi:Integrase core domain